jgi:hypothetical protein
VCSLNVLLMRPQPPGRLVGHAGDIDNRLKTLFDALRMPSAQELDQAGVTAKLLAPNEDDWPMMFCLLQDDALITSVSVETDRLFGDIEDPKAVVVVAVDIKGTRTSLENLPLIT